MNNNHCNKHRLKKLMQYHEKTLSILQPCLAVLQAIIYRHEQSNHGVLHLILLVLDHVLVGLCIFSSVSLV